MGWQGFPVGYFRVGRGTHWNQIIAAANERNAETLKAAELEAVTVGRLVRRPTVEAIRARVEALIPCFFNPETGTAWTKAACLTAAIGQPNWTTPVIGKNTLIRRQHVNEPYAVLNALCWLGIQYSSYNWQSIYVYGTGATWDLAWAAAKANYAVANYGGGAFGCVAGLTLFAPPPLLEYITHSRVVDVPYVIPNPGKEIVATKLAIGYVGPFHDDAVMQAYMQANFAGTVYPFTISSGLTSGIVSVEVPAVAKGSTIHVSLRTIEARLAPEVLDLYRPPNNDSFGYRYRMASLTDLMWGSGNKGLLIKLGFDYLPEEA